MPYEPNTWSRTERERNFSLIWFGAAGSIVALGIYLWNPAAKHLGALGPFLGFSAGSVIASAFRAKQDDYFLAMCAKGLQWMGSFVALHMVTIWCLRMFDTGNGWIAGLMTHLSDAYFISLVAVVIFHAGYGYAWLRGR